MITETYNVLILILKHVEKNILLYCDSHFNEELKMRHSF